jgi:exodeoxyribonuclease VII large subunit
MEYQSEKFPADGRSFSEDRQQRAALTVGQLNEYIRMLIEGNPVLSRVWVKGELSNVTSHRSGHVYFSLKDEEGVVRAVMFRSAASILKFIPEEGMKVVIRGRVTLYGKTGQYQINVEAMQPDGVGALYVAYEQLRRRLEAEGLFDPARKQRLPKYPKRIGIITSPTGAAIQDMMQIAGRRFPLTKLLLYPSLVQGDGAAAQLAEGIRFFERARREGSACDVDCIIIGRGGGSMEDLWAFNDERVVRAIAASDIPVISAVGHETDYTLADFVADKRAPTPSAAAELAVPDRAEFKIRLDDAFGRSENVFNRLITVKKTLFNSLAKQLDLCSPVGRLQNEKNMLTHRYELMEKAMMAMFDRRKDRLGWAAGRLDAINPLAILGRGYSITKKNDGSIIGSAAKLKEGEDISILFADGEAQARILAVRKSKTTRKKEKANG